MKETSVETHVRHDAAQLGVDLWRNNVGVAWQGQVTHLNDGSVLIANPRPVRYGLCNESTKQNTVIKSSDWIGMTPIIVTLDMVGQKYGIFTAVETKHSGWTFNINDKHSLAQAKFHDIVRSNGGFAGFVTCREDFRKIINHEK